ncbi:hypothetical protein [Pseudomonas sp. 24 E 13]|jgi:hypothetical protein|nr:MULTISPECIES: hypothetical protein [unclassified Pseudomonas]MDO4237562.1 hypothetical protein [Pseudomonas sp.]CRM19110.1 hypothetical protein [Pseudomonas sp. 28 E 9]CRM30550.1 hypothetical protein [Pseudomonas sp. 24 E 13]
MRTLIQLVLITLMLGTAVLTNPAVANELRTGHLLSPAAGVNSVQCCTGA